MPVSALAAACGFAVPGHPVPRAAGLRRALCAGLVGALLTAGQPPLGLIPAAILGWVLAARLWAHAAAASPRAAFNRGWALGAGFFASGLWWIAEAFFVDAAAHGWMAPFAIAGLAAGLGLFWGGAFALAALAAGRARRAHRGIFAAVLFAAAIAATEMLRAYVLTGFPWALPAYALAQSPIAQTAALVGPHALGAIFVLLCAAPALAAGGAGRAGLAALCLAALGGAWLWGDVRQGLAPEPGPDAPQIRVVQPNVPQAEKWAPELRERNFADLLTLSAPDPAGPRADLILWPETAGPWILHREPAIRTAIASAAGGATVLTGVRRIGLDAAGLAEWRNGMEAVGPDGELVASYDKHHLVPFGEFLPLGETLRKVGLGAFVGASFGSGPGPRRMRLPGLPEFQPQICYETIFPHEVLGGAQRPAFIAQATNDAWFGASAGPRQHFQQARMRAIEQGLPVIRAANTGISAVIDARGRVIASLPLLERGAIQAAAPPADPPTPYARSGDVPGAAAILVALVLGALGLRAARAPGAAKG